MCGINGFIAKKNYSNKLDKMNNITKHRGPDNSSAIVENCSDKYIGMGHNRLSIIDLSQSANQPFVSEDKQYSLIYNGELYNYIELKKELELKGIAFSTNSDTEVVLQSLITWGISAFNKFNGMWAIAFLNKKNNNLIISRDRFGEKPFYYCIEDNELYFSSEIKAILEVTKKKKINLMTVNRFLKNGSLDSTNETFLNNIEKVPASTYSIINLNNRDLKVNFITYWDISSIKLNKNIQETQAIKEFDKVFTDSVKIRLRSDVKVGTLLSGGLDSSAITEVMAKHIPNLEILSAVSNSEEYSEEKFIDIVSKAIGVSPKKINLDNDPYKIWNLLEKVLWHNDEPMPSFSVIAHYMLMSKAHENDIKVILSGQGGDELLAGYQKYYIFYIIQLFKERQYLSFFREGFYYLFNSGLIKQFSIKEANRYLPSFLKSKINKTDVRTQKLKELDNKIEDIGRFMSIQERQIADLMKYSVPALTHYEDRMSMAYSREIRLPFLDYRLVELALSLPHNLKMKKGWTKWILRKIIDGKLPDSIVWRKDKKGFNTPQEQWFRDDLKDTIDKMFNEDLLVEKYELMEKNKIKKLYKEFLENDKIWYKEIFNIISLEVWLKVFERYIEK
jgi:asparagine synthase (glutamine-hydrolysing)